MPPKARKVRRVRRRPRMVRGGNKFTDWVKNKALPWLKKTGAVSKVANALGSVGVPFASQVGKVASSVGYGRRRRRPAARRVRRRVRGGAMPIGLPAGVPQGTPMAYYPWAVNNSRARF